MVVQLKAHDSDNLGPLKYEIENLPNLPFFIKNDRLFTKETIDYMENSNYVFQISVSDGLHKVTTTANITIRDVNNNPPVFVSESRVWKNLNKNNKF